ncbi:styrene monooxygenase/indole monooxygenase family protein [Nocardia colli]|uniref:styrene monooxygenase/indole monooxygenase family protein n=1 Tax=Nocardia colli TaxID=2545717 RepID=UPI0035E0C8CC
MTLVTDRSSDSVLAGSVTGAQAKFPATQDIQNDLGLGFWQDSAPEIQGIDVTIVVEQRVVHTWSGRFARPWQSVDQRTVFARWLDLYVRMGGHLIIDELSRDIVDDWASEYELTVVTHGAQDLLDCFPVRGTGSDATRPVRRTGVLYLDGVQPHGGGMGTCVMLPGLGEIVSYAALTGRPGVERACEVLLFDAVPGAGLDVFGTTFAPDERRRRAMAVLEEYLPASMSSRYRNAELTDPGATLASDVTPCKRIPVGVLPSGQLILGGGEVVQQTDPGGVQCTNNAVFSALRYAKRIIANEDGVFDRDWMWQTADRSRPKPHSPPFTGRRTA